MAKRRFDSEKEGEQPESPESTDKPESKEKEGKEKEGKKEAEDMDSLLDEDEKENPESREKPDNKEAEDDEDDEKKEVDDALDKDEIDEKKEGILSRFEGKDKEKMGKSLEKLDDDDILSFSDTLEKYDQDKKDGKMTEGQYKDRMEDVPDAVDGIIDSRETQSDEKKIQKILDRPDATQEDAEIAGHYQDLKEAHKKTFGEELDGRLNGKKAERQEEIDEADELADSVPPETIKDREVLIQDEVDEGSYTPEELDELYETFPGDLNEKVLDTESETYQETGKREVNWNDGADKYGDAIEGTERMRELQPGEEVMRYGGEGGTYLTDEGTSREKLELPGDKGEEHHYKVLKPIPVVESKVQQQKWNWKDGDKPDDIDPEEAATQYQTPMSMKQLKDEGYIEEAGDPKEEENTEGEENESDDD